MNLTNVSHSTYSVPKIDGYSIVLVFILVQFLIFAIGFQGPNSSPDNETIAKYEIMDGAPVRGRYISFPRILYVYFLFWFRYVVG